MSVDLSTPRSPNPQTAGCKKTEPVVAGRARDGMQQQGQNDPKQLQVHSELEKDYLFPLKKRSIKFPNAKFFCRLCEYHCDDVGHCYRHMKDTRHKRLKKVCSHTFGARSSILHPKCYCVVGVDIKTGPPACGCKSCPILALAF